MDHHIPRLELAGIFPSSVAGATRSSQADRLHHTMSYNSSGTCLALGNEGDSVKIYDPINCRSISSLCEVVRAKRTGCSHLSFPGNTSTLADDALLLSSRHVVDNHVYSLSLERGEYTDAFNATSAPCGSWSAAEAGSAGTPGIRGEGGGGGCGGKLSNNGDVLCQRRYVAGCERSRDLGGDQGYFTQLFSLPHTNLFGACAGGTINLWSPSRRDSIMHINTRFGGAATVQFGHVAFSQQQGRSHFFVATTATDLIGMDLRSPTQELWSIPCDKIFPSATLKAASHWAHRLEGLGKSGTTGSGAGSSGGSANGSANGSDEGSGTPQQQSTDGPLTLTESRAARHASRVSLNHFGALSVSPTDDNRILCTHSVTSDSVLVNVARGESKFAEPTVAGSTKKGDEDAVKIKEEEDAVPPAVAAVAAGPVGPREPKFSAVLLTKGTAAQHLGKFAGGVSTDFSLTPHPFYSVDSPVADADATTGVGETKQPLYDRHNSQQSTHGKQLHNYLESDWRYCGGSTAAKNLSSGTGPVPPGKNFLESQYHITGWQTPRLTLCCPAVFMSNGQFIVQGTFRQRIMVFDARKSHCPFVDVTSRVMPMEGGTSSTGTQSLKSLKSLFSVGAVPTIQANPMFSQIATADTKLLLWAAASDAQNRKLDAEDF